MKHASITHRLKFGHVSGFSMLEILLILGVVTLLFLAAMALYKITVRDAIATETVRLIATIKGQTQVVFNNDGDYGIVSIVPTLVAREAFPPDVVDPGGNPIDPWNNVIQVVGNNQTFDITFVSVPSTQCIRIGTAFSQRDTDFSQLDINGTIFDTGNPIVTDQLAIACTAAANVTMTWSFF